MWRASPGIRIGDYRLRPRRELDEGEQARIASPLELRSLVRRWARDEGQWSLRFALLCRDLDLDHEADAAELAELVLQRIAFARDLVMVRDAPIAMQPREHVEARDELLHSRDEALEWIEVQLVDEEDQPVAGVGYTIKLSDGRVRHGRTNANGVLRYEQIPGGPCELTWELDEKAWERA